VSDLQFTIDHEGGEAEIDDWGGCEGDDGGRGAE
jgi:hypothetical protein